MAKTNKKVDQPQSYNQRLFLGWNKPVLPQVVEQLWHRYQPKAGRNRSWDLSNIQIVLPGGLAKRRLNELLLIKAQELQIAYRPPKIDTLGSLPEQLYEAKKPLASEVVQVLAWMSALKHTPQADLQQVIPHPPEANAYQQWLELGKVLAKLHQELASDRLTFSDVVAALGKNHPDADRWLALAGIQRSYLQRLHELDLWDIQTARIEALKRHETHCQRQIIVIGCVDLNRAQRGFLESISQQVQIWIAAPAEKEHLFDAWGAIDGERWSQTLVELSDDSLLVGNSPSDQAELVAASLAELGATYHTRQITLGVPDSELIPELQYQLDLCGVTTRFGPGRPLAQSEPAQLLSLMANYIEQQSFSALAALVRHPSIPNLFRSLKVELPEDWLSQLDKYYQEVLPKTVNGFVNQQASGAVVFQAVSTAIAKWLNKLTRRNYPVSQWVQPLLNALMMAYDQAHCHLDNPLESQLYTAAKDLTSAILTVRDIPAEVEPKMSSSELIDWLLRNLSSQLVPQPPSETAIEMLGWLELALDDSPVLFVVGIHDGVVPESTNADPFLPNQLRRQLGMLDNTRRFARDMYHLHVMLHSREHIRFIVGKTTASGDPLVPSRLLLACPLEQLPSRVLHLISEEHTDVLPPVKSRWKPLAGGSNLPIPRPEQVRKPSNITVTAFRDYLKCPYRFYLRHILKLRGEDDADVELDASQFGVLVHAALDQFGRNPVSRSRDPVEISEFLITELHSFAAKQFGPSPTVSILIQIEQAQARLEAFAQKQAQRSAEGWEIRFTECGSTIESNIRIGKKQELRLIGRIDRIDYHPGMDQWAIWDYKTSESAKNPVSVHWSSKDGWTDLQLPLYIPIAKALGIKGTPILGYIGLPKLERDIGFHEANFSAQQLTEAMQVAAEVASKVAACEFYPEDPKEIDFDDFKRICQVQTQQVRVDPPIRKVHRTSHNDRRVVPSETVKLAQAQLSNSIERAAIRLPPMLIKASAGTGKTFRLTNRLLHILLSGQDVDSILATTFTKKAAGEILQRVLQRLALGCLDEKKREELSKFISDVDLSAANYLATLRRVTASIHRFRISTLDSFFAQVARTFSLDMALPPGWTTMDPVREPQAQSQAIAELVDNHDRQTLMDIVRMLSKGETTRRVSEEIRTTVQYGYSIFRATPAEAWDQLSVPKAPDEGALKSALQCLLNSQFSDGRITAALQKLHHAASVGDWESVAQQGIYKKLQDDPPTYYNKSLPRNLVVALELLLDRAASEILAICRRQTLASFDVLKAYHQTYTGLIRRQRTLAFSDVCYFLAKWISDGKLNDSGKKGLQQLAFRMDCGIQHLLLDEFQDTSLEQWQILRPVAQPLGGPPASDRSFFCVGDTKQAIYGWRGGVAEIFDAVDQSISGIQEDELSESHRSSPQIMQVVNQVFKNLQNHDNFSDCSAQARSWSDAFPIHKTALQDRLGYVELCNGPKFDNREMTADEKRVEFLAFTADRIAQLSRQCTASIGVLLRTNADITRMIALLRSMGVSASQGGGNALNDSAAVELILSLIHLADHPGDGICAHHVFQSPLLAAIPEHLQKNRFLISDWLRTLISRQGLGKTVEWLSDKLADRLGWWDQLRLQQLIRSAYSFQASKGRLREFEELVQQQRVALPTEAQVKVLTIHSSKGLEYDAVFLPELDSPLTDAKTQLVTRHQHRCAPPNGVLRYMNAANQKLLPKTWQKAFDDHKIGTLHESLCILYVAMTRARSALYLITHAAGRSARQDYSSLLHSTLISAKDKAKAATPETRLLSLGNENWHAPLKRQSATETDTNSMIERLEISLRNDSESAPLRGMRITAPSRLSSTQTSNVNYSVKMDASPSTLTEPSPQRSISHRPDSLETRPEVVCLADAFSLSHAVNTAYGTLMHLLFEQIHWLEDFKPDRERLRALIMARMSPDDLQHLSIPQGIDDFINSLNLPNVRGILSRTRYQRDYFGIRPTQVEINNEHSIRALLDGQVIEGIIDRLAILYQDDRAYAAEIIDYKLDAADPKMSLLWLEDRLEFHRPQIQMYADVIAQQLQIPRSHVSAHLLMLSTDDLLDIN